MGVEIGSTGAIAVNEKMQTNLPDVYACGDCAESFSIVDGRKLYRPLGSTANKMGRIAGDVVDRRQPDLPRALPGPAFSRCLR